METARIVFLGSGNVAGHLAAAFKASGAEIVQVYSPNAEHAGNLAVAVGALAVDDLSLLCSDADFYVVSVTDSAVAATAAAMPRVRGTVVHTSGSVPMDVLFGASDRVGVLYPLQTFSKGRELDMSVVPFFNEASDDATLRYIDGMASRISGSVFHADSSTRPFLHVAGVLGCNFPNYLLGCAAEVLSRGGYKLDVLRPLLQETVAKAFEFGPYAAQTGPAVRGDRSTIERHGDMLPAETAELYRMLSEQIMKVHNKL